MASASATATRSEITIKGSVEIVTEFFGYAVNSILYQRGVYPPESFTAVAKYGLSLLVTSDEGLKTYLAQVLRQVAGENILIQTTCSSSRDSHPALQRGCQRARCRSLSSS